MYIPAIIMPGIKEAAYRSMILTFMVGAITINGIAGGIIISDPPPAMTPAESFGSYPNLIILGAAIMPSRVTAAPTTPVARLTSTEMSITT
jgi:hypothetical protein